MTTICITRPSFPEQGGSGALARSFGTVQMYNKLIINIVTLIFIIVFLEFQLSKCGDRCTDELLFTRKHLPQKALNNHKADNPHQEKCKVNWIWQWLGSKGINVAFR